jgi:hypothetical protein
MVEGAGFAAVSRVVTALSAAIAGGAAVSSKAAIPHVAANGKIKRGKLAMEPHLSIWTSVADRNHNEHVSANWQFYG